VPYKNVNEKLFHLSHLLSLGSPRDTYRQGVLQEEDLTQFNGAQSQARQAGDTLNIPTISWTLCHVAPGGPLLPVTPFAVEEESAESVGGQEAILRVFRVCGLTNDQDRPSLNKVGEFIYSFSRHFQGGSQHLEEACMRGASSLELLCPDCYASRKTPVLQETC
jgi:hypothetical protein